MLTVVVTNAVSPELAVVFMVPHDKFGQEKKSGQRQVFAATNGPPLNKISLQFIATFCVLTVYHKSAIVHVNSLLPTCVLNSSTDSRIIFMYLLVNLCDSSTFIFTALNRSYSSLSIYFQHLLHVVHRIITMQINIVSQHFQCL